jgi:hypothetical protein
MALKLFAAALVLTISTSAMARKYHRGMPNGQGYNQTDTGFAIWNYAAFRYYHPRCTCCRR